MYNNPINVFIRLLGVTKGRGMAKINCEGKHFIHAVVIFYAFLYLLSGTANLSAQSLTLMKSVEPSVGRVGDTVTVCLSINPALITMTANSKADIMWVIDCTGSMDTEIQGIKDNLTSFTSQLVAAGIDYREGLEEYRDMYDPFPGDPTEEKNYGFAASDSQFLGWVGGLIADGGGDWPEAGLEGLEDAALNTAVAFWRPDASKTLILITDAPVKSMECDSAFYSTMPLSMTYTAHSLYSSGFVIDAVCNSIAGYYGSQYSGCDPSEMPGMAGGVWLDLSSTTNWASFLAQLGTSILNYTNVKVRDPMPPELAPIDGACGATVTGNELEWNFPQVNSSGVFNVCCFLAKITSAFDGSISNTAYVSADGVSETSSNNEYVFYPTNTSTSTITPTWTYTPTFTISATFTPTYTVTMTGTPTITPTVTVTLTPTPLPLVLNLKGNFPNPMMNDTHIVYWLSTDADVSIKVYTVSGEVVLNHDGLPGLAGYDSFYWDGKNRATKPVASGVLIYRISAVSPRNEHQEKFSKLAVVK